MNIIRHLPGFQPGTHAGFSLKPGLGFGQDVLQPILANTNRAISIKDNDIAGLNFGFANCDRCIELSYLGTIRCKASANLTWFLPEIRRA